MVGNEAVHPGMIDLRDDYETVSKLFKLTNFIADKLISEPKEVEEIYTSKLSQSDKNQIKARDKENADKK